MCKILIIIKNNNNKCVSLNMKLVVLTRVNSIHRHLDTSAAVIN